MYREYVPSARNSSYSFRPILFKLYRCFSDGLKICILFLQNPEIIFYHIFCIFNLDFFRALILQKCIGSVYLLPATPPTVLDQSFSDFTGAFRMVWRYAYCFFRILKLFFITFYCIFNRPFGVFFFVFFFELWNNCLLLLFMFNLDCFQPLYYRSA